MELGGPQGARPAETTTIADYIGVLRFPTPPVGAIGSVSDRPRQSYRSLVRERLIEHHGQSHPSLSEPPLNQFAANKLRTVDILHHPWPAGAALHVFPSLHRTIQGRR
jgi:hypothetical protein